MAELVLNLGMGGGGGGELYLMLHSHQQNVSHIKMDSGESCSYASLIGWSEVAKTALNLFKAELSLNRYWQGPRSVGGWRGGGGCYLYLTLHYYHQNVSCIKMDSGESCFNASLTGRVKDSDHKPQLWKRKNRRSGCCYVQVWV